MPPAACSIPKALFTMRAIIDGISVMFIANTTIESKI